MINIKRDRYIITRNDDTEIFCGLARHYKFVKIEELGDTILKSYSTRNKAISAFERSYDDYSEPKYNCIKVIETVCEVYDE